MCAGYGGWPANDTSDPSRGLPGYFFMVSYMENSRATRLLLKGFYDLMWKILGLWSDPTLAIPAGAVDGQVLPAVHLLDRGRLGVQAHRPR